MLNIVRRHSKSYFTKALLILIGLSFVVGFGLLTGLDQSSMSGASTVASINGDYITNVQLEKSYLRLYERYRNQLGDLDPDLLKKLNLRFQALNILINQTIIQQKAEELGFRVSDEEILDVLGTIPAFLNEQGQFDPRYYKAVLGQQNPRINPVDFEAEQRRYLTIDKLQSFVRSTIIVTEEEVLQSFIRRNSTISANVAVFKPQNFVSKAVVSNAEAEAYFADNADRFLTGDQAEIEYIRISPGKFSKEVKASDEEVKAYYDANPEKFQSSEEEVKARHILLKVEQDAPDSEREATRKRLEAIRQKAIDGADFSELARSNSEDPGSAVRGGDLGWFGKGKMVPPFDKAAFATPKNKISDVIETSFGYHIILVEDHKMPGKIDFDIAKDSARTKVLAQKRADAVNALKAKVQKELAAGVPPALAAKAGPAASYKKDSWRANDPANSTQYPGSLGTIITDGSADSNQGKWTSFSGVEYWMHVISRSPSESLPFNEVKGQIVQALKQDKALTIAAEAASESLDAVRKGTPLAAMAAKHGVQIQPTGPVSLEAKTIPAIGDDPIARRTLFALTEKNPVPDNTIRIKNDYYVFALDERKDVTLEEFKAEAETFRREITEKKEQEAWEIWVRDIKKDADIEILNAPADMIGEEEKEI